MTNVNFDWLWRSDDENDDGWIPHNLALKLLLIGGRNSGKSTLLRAFQANPFDPTHKPLNILADNCSVCAIIGGKGQYMTAWDTPNNRHETLMLMKHTDVALLCVPCVELERDVDAATFKLLSTFVADFRRRCPRAPIILVGCMSDLSRSRLAVREAMACRLGVQAYKDCSALTDAGIDEMLIEAVRIAVDQRGHDRLSIMRNRATEICIALQALDLPALVTLTILDAALDNNVRMAAKWGLVTAVKHFRDKDRDHAGHVAEQVSVTIRRDFVLQLGPEDNIPFVVAF